MKKYPTMKLVASRTSQWRTIRILDNFEQRPSIPLEEYPLHFPINFGAISEGPDLPII